jgi:hypothetical protein
VVGERLLVRLVHRLVVAAGDERPDADAVRPARRRWLAVELDSHLEGMTERLVATPFGELPTQAVRRRHVEPDRRAVGGHVGRLLGRGRNAEVDGESQMLPSVVDEIRVAEDATARILGDERHDVRLLEPRPDLDRRRLLLAVERD